MEKLILLQPRNRRISLEGHSGFRDGKLVLHETKEQLEVFFLGLDVFEAESVLLPLIRRRDYDCRVVVPPKPEEPDRVHLIVRCGFCEQGLRNLGGDDRLIDTDFLNGLITDAVTTDGDIPRRNLEYNDTDVSTDLRDILRRLGIIDSTDMFTEQQTVEDSTDLITNQETDFILTGLDIGDSTDLVTIQLSVEIRDVENWFGV